MQNRVQIWLAILSLWLPVSCASLFTGQTEELYLNSQPPGANVVINGSLQLQTPGRVKVQKDSKVYLEFSKEGYQDERRMVDYKFSSALLLNFGLLYFAPVGAGVDLISGGGYEHVTNQVDVYMRPLGQAPREGDWPPKSPSTSESSGYDPTGPATTVLPPQRDFGWEETGPSPPYRVMLRYGFLGGSELNENNSQFKTLLDGDSFALRLARLFSDTNLFWAVELRTSTRRSLAHHGEWVERNFANYRGVTAGLGYQWDIGTVHPRLVASVASMYVHFESQSQNGDCGYYACDQQEVIIHKSPKGFDVMAEAAIDLYGPLAVVPIYRAGYYSEDLTSLKSSEAGIGLEMSF